MVCESHNVERLYKHCGLEAEVPYGVSRAEGAGLYSLGISRRVSFPASEHEARREVRSGVLN